MMMEPALINLYNIRHPIPLIASIGPSWYHSPMSAVSKVTIDNALTAFLESQRDCLAPQTFCLYEDVVQLLAHCLNGYGHLRLTKTQLKRFESAYNAGDEEPFCHLFAPPVIVDNLGEFLGYFMIRKVSADQELLQAAGTVTQALGTWLHDQGWIGDKALASALELGGDAALDLPKAEKLTGMLYDMAQRTPNVIGDRNAVSEGDWVEDSLWIERVEPGALWFKGGIGPLKVPNQISALAQVNWSITVVLIRRLGVWHLLEVGNVYPS